jgi:hypothetical protein
VCAALVFVSQSEPGHACGCHDTFPDGDWDNAGHLKRETRNGEPNFAA